MNSSVNGLHFYSAFLTSGYSKRFIILPDIHRCMHHAGRQPARREESGRGVSLRDTSTRDTINLLVTSQPILPPQPHAALYSHVLKLFSILTHPVIPSSSPQLQRRLSSTGALANLCEYILD